MHVTWKVLPGLPNLRGRKPFRAIRRSLVAASRLHGMRIVEFSVQINHLHLLVEADGRSELLRALRALGVRLARRVNAAFARSGRVLADRYHARALRTPLEVKRALRYVLSNSKHHAGPVDVGRSAGILDGCSTAPWFQGFIDPDTHARCFVVPRAGPTAGEPRSPVAPARTWLLREGWKRHGGIDADEIPGMS